MIVHVVNCGHGTTIKFEKNSLGIFMESERFDHGEKLGFIGVYGSPIRSCRDPVQDEKFVVSVGQRNQHTKLRTFLVQVLQCGIGKQSNVNAPRVKRLVG